MTPNNNFWKSVTVVSYLLVAFLAVMVIKEIKSINYVGKSDQLVNTISVSGKGEVVSKPDVAAFSFSVTETAKNVSDAQTAATNKINKALQVVRDAGVEDRDIQTVSYTINPHYENQRTVCPISSNGTVVYCPPGKPVMNGYEVSQTIRVKVRQLDKAGSIFASIGALDVQNVNGLDFTIDDPDSIKTEARAKAIIDAQNKAKVLAKELGVSLVSVTGFYESNGDYPIYGMGGGISAMKSESAVPAPEIPAGEQKVTNMVTITYEIR